MSYDIDLIHPVTRKTLQLDKPHQMKGGTYALGGTTDASLNITYNYSSHYYRVFPMREVRESDLDYVKEQAAKNDSNVGGIRSIYGLTGAESIPVLDAAIAQLGDDVDPDYWKATEGNAKAALTQLKALAQLRPDGIWSGD